MIIKNNKNEIFRIGKKIERAGFLLCEKRCKHPIWRSNKTGKTFALSHHRNQEVATGTLKKIIELSGADI